MGERMGEGMAESRDIIDSPAFVPGPDSPAWLAAMGDADRDAERVLESAEFRRFEYEDLLESKTHYGADSGFSPIFMPDFLFPFQRSLVEWAVRRGRGGMLADCGLGKTPMQFRYGPRTSTVSRTVPY